MNIRNYLLAALLLLLTAGSMLSAQTVADVVTFDNTNYLANPGTTPAQSRDGKLYGEIYGYAYPGDIFDFTPAGDLSLVHVLNLNYKLGGNPLGGPTLATDGNFYGSTQNGGTYGWGVLFKVTPGGSYTVLHDFTGGIDGGEATGGPIEAADGNVYGTTYGGCCLSSTVYKYNRYAGTFSTIYTFDYAHGLYADSVMQASDGNLYVTAAEGGATNNGTVVKLTTSGKVLSYYSFPGGHGGGAVPVGPLVEDADGNLYGTTTQGGVLSDGIIYRITPSLKVTRLYAFCSLGGLCADGYFPGALVLGSDGNLYGAAFSGGANSVGTLFRISTTGSFTSLYSFNTSVGYQPSGLMQDTNGLFYGSVAYGAAYGYGAIYSLDMGLAPFITFVLPTAKAGQPAQILGQGLTGTTGVTFNAVAATKFTVVSDTYMTAIVPTGATTGPVVVTTPTITLSSNVNFRISK